MRKQKIKQVNKRYDGWWWHVVITLLLLLLIDDWLTDWLSLFLTNLSVGGSVSPLLSLFLLLTNLARHHHSRARRNGIVVVGGFFSIIFISHLPRQYCTKYRRRLHPVIALPSAQPTARRGIFYASPLSVASFPGGGACWTMLGYYHHRFSRATIRYPTPSPLLLLITYNFTIEPAVRCPDVQHGGVSLFRNIT